jgi:diadenosine tetraphosphatase ApaH/serine/threonine PP2A family protein phosphatase
LFSEKLYQSSITANAADFVKIIDAATDSMERQRQYSNIPGGSITPGFAELKIPQNVVIIGDIHGDINSLFHILKNIDFERFLANSRNKVIFMGDYVDRGSQSIAVLYTICYLKQKYPHSVILMRGNHEAACEFPFSSHDLPFKFEERYGEKGKRIYINKILPFFRLLILLTLIQRQVLIVHGGLPTRHIGGMKDIKNSIATADKNIHNGWMEEILWNDPRQHIQNHQEWEPSRRGIGRHFGINISKSWLKLTKTKMIIRGHEPCRGYKIDHDGMIVTLFSCKEAYPNFEAAYLSITASQWKSICNGRDLAHYILKIM